MGIIKSCLLNVKEIKFKNEIDNVNFRWKFDKETGILEIETQFIKGTTHGLSHSKINNALRDYNGWM